MTIGYPTTDEQTTMMIGRTRKGDPVWRTDKKGRPFTLAEDGKTKNPLKPLLWRWRWWPSRIRRLPEPHLSYSQVAAVHVKAKKILNALSNGPIRLDKSFLKSYSNNIILTRALATVALHWMEGCGMVFVKQKLKDGRIEIDLDTEATEKNHVR